MRQRLLECFKGFCFTEMPQKTQNQGCIQSQLGLRIAAGAMQAIDDGCSIESVAGMGLRIEKNFCVNDVVGCGPGQIGPCHVVKVLLGLEHRGTGVIDVQKTLQVVELVGGTQTGYIRIRQGHLVSPGQIENHFWFERTLNVHVKFGFGDGAQQGRQPLGREFADGGQGAQRGMVRCHQLTPKVRPSSRKWRR